MFSISYCNFLIQLQSDTVQNILAEQRLGELAAFTIDSVSFFPEFSKKNGHFKSRKKVSEIPQINHLHAAHNDYHLPG